MSDALDNIDKLIEKSEKDMKNLSQVVEKHIRETKHEEVVVPLKEEVKNEQPSVKVDINEKKNKIELDW